MSAVVVGYIASAEGDAAVGQGIAEAKLRGCSLVVVYSDQGEKVDSAPATDRETSLEHVHERLRDSGVPHDVRHILRSKDPVGDVLEAADEAEADLIVIGIRRRSPVGKLVLGSHSQSILLEANIPVLAVKA